MDFSSQILQGIPASLPPKKKRDPNLNPAPKRKDILSADEKKLAVRNALRYFPKNWHTILAKEFAEELQQYGRIYMYRFMPNYAMKARPIDQYPAKSEQAAAIMLMIQNNLDPTVAQHPQELITYGGNGSVFQNWAQYLLTMKYLVIMNNEQTLHMYSGHPMGIFPSGKEAPRVVVTNGMMVIMHRSGGIANRLDIETDRKIRDLVKGTQGNEVVLERAGGSFTFEIDVKSEGWQEPKKPVRPSNQRMQVDEVAMKSYFDALWEEPEYEECVRCESPFHRR